MTAVNGILRQKGEVLSLEGFPEAQGVLSDLNICMVFLLTLKMSASTAASLEEAFLPASPLIAPLITPSQQVCQCCGHSCLLWQVWTLGPLLFAEG